MSWLSRQLEKTKKILTTPVDELFTGKKEITEGLLDQLEEALITGDVGVGTTERLLSALREKIKSGELTEAKDLKKALAEEARVILKAPAASPKASPAQAAGPRVILMVGVNGSGKTTTIGKLAKKFKDEGKSVLVVAADTFRAAAVEQLAVWAERAGVSIVRGKPTADPAAVVFDGLEAARARNMDLVLVDTAGRLQTKVNLMEELKKVRRTASKVISGAPHEVWLVLDAGTGQNALSQARLFNEATALTGIVLAKVDGTAKGGMVIGICHELGVPVLYLGLGEKISDIKEFDPDEFVDALFYE